MPDTTSRTGLPGVLGQDYFIVKYGGKVYVVYKQKVGGKFINISWRVDPDEYKTFGINPDKLKTVTSAEFKSYHFFGDAGEVVRRGKPGESPLQTYLRDLYELYGKKVSWIKDKEVMELYFMAYLEQWSAEELSTRLKRTKWYQSRTQTQINWEMDTSRANKQAALKQWKTQLSGAVEELWGPNFAGESGISQQQLAQYALDIASGKYGDPATGFEIVYDELRDKAQKVEGTQAWIDNESAAEEQRAFLNRPEDLYQQLKDEAQAWLGPAGMLDRDTLWGWAKDLVSEKRSEGDWQGFLQKHAKSLYPWLGPNEAWQDRASSYKNIVEQNLGVEVGWDHPLLQQIGGIGPDGAPTGAASTFHDFEVLVRKDPLFWQSPAAYEEGFDLLNQLNYVFNGVG